MLSYTSISSISEEAFNKLFGSLDNYCQYCLSTMSNDELELLNTLCDENGMIYFIIYLETVTLQIPVCVKDLFKEPDILEFVTTVTAQLKEQNMYDDEM